jgi:hypothetical protein
MLYTCTDMCKLYCGSMLYTCTHMCKLVLWLDAMQGWVPLAPIASVGFTALTTWAGGLLQEGADQGTLGQPGHRYLNSGLLVASVAHVIILGSWYMGGDYGTWVMPALVGTWGTGIAASLMGLFSKSRRP